MKIDTSTIKTFRSDWEQACYDMGIEPIQSLDWESILKISPQPHDCFNYAPLFGPEADEAMKRLLKK